MNQAIHILGSGWYVPHRRVTNDDLSRIMDTTHEWIASRTGIHARHISEHEGTIDLAVEAAQQAIANAKMNPQDIDVIIVATMTPDHYTPSTACLVQHRLGLQDNHVMAFDVNAACTGFLYALQLAASMLSANESSCALVIGAETMSKLLDWNDRNTSILFGDGAGAMIISSKASETSLTIKGRYHYSASRGDHEHVLAAPGIPPRQLFSSQNTQKSYITMDGKEVFRFAIDAMMKSITAVLDKASCPIEDIDMIVPHQANSRIIQAVMRRFELPESKVFMNLDEYGNTSAASIAIAFAQLHEQKRLQKGMKIILVGFGAGFTWGAAYLEL